MTMQSEIPKSHVTSFCPHCGEVTSWEMQEDHANRNRIPCTSCLKHVLAIIDADDVMSSAHYSRAQQIEAERKMRVALASLAARRREIVMAHSKQCKEN